MPERCIEIRSPPASSISAVCRQNACPHRHTPTNTPAASNSITCAVRRHQLEVCCSKPTCLQHDLLSRSGARLRRTLRSACRQWLLRRLASSLVRCCYTVCRFGEDANGILHVGSTWRPVWQTYTHAYRLRTCARWHLPPASYYLLLACTQWLCLPALNTHVRSASLLAAFRPLWIRL